VRARDALRIAVGLPVYYLGLEVGQVTSAGLAADGDGIEVHVFVNAPYDAYIGTSTRFWNASGVDLSMRGGDVSLRTESMIALLVGGIAFENVDGAKPAAEAPPRTQFRLYRDRGAALKADDSRDPRYVLFFDEPVDGLQVGSPVMFLGVQVGEVHRVGLAVDAATGRVRGRVELSVSPARAMQAGVEPPRGEGDALLRALVTRHGVRAQLRASSLLTGQRYVAFDYFSRAGTARVDWNAAEPALPVVPSMLPAFEDKLARLMDKLDGMPLVEAVGDARSLMREAKGTLASVHGLADDVDRKALPQFVSTMQDAQRALDSAQRMLDGATATLVGPDAPGQRDLRAALQEMTRAAHALRTLSDSVERHPESLVWGRSAMQGRQ
jgi:paraquat-inducible protein B